MGKFPISRFFRLNVDGVRCDERGLFVGGAPMLEHSARPGGREGWTPRPAAELNCDLEACYDFPVDASAKQGGLAVVARALERDDLALAQIAALLLRFPDPPSLTKDSSAQGAAALARQLIDCGLLKTDWDSAKHPRTGEPPNPGWFAPKDDEDVQVAENDAEPRPTMTDAPSKPIWVEPAESEGAPPASTREPPSPAGPPEPEPSAEAKPERPFAEESPRDVMKALRALLKAGIFPLVEAGLAVDWLDSKIQDLIDEATAKLNWLTLCSPQNMILMALRARADAEACKGPPKTLTELQTPPTENASGYDQHHLVQQNPSNVVKSPGDVQIDKFGRNALDAPSNLVWLPRSKHQLITDYYNSVDPNDALGRLRRQVVADMDFEAQREEALATLRRFGVLQ
jgi:hypothetical protein